MINKANEIVTSFNQKINDENYRRYDIGANYKNIFLEYQNTQGEEKTTNLKILLDNIITGCIDKDTLNFKLNYPLQIKGSGSSSNIIYDGSSQKTIDLSKFLSSETTKWNNLPINDTANAYLDFSWNAGDEISDIVYKNNNFTKVKRTNPSAYSYPRYSASLSYRPSSLCKMTLPKGKFLISYGVQVVNKYDTLLTNNLYTPTSKRGTYKYFSDDNGKIFVNPGIITATLCNDDTFDRIKNHDYKDYPDDKSAASNDYFIGSAAHTAPRVTGSTVNSAYTSKTFILNITNPNTIYHVMVNHWNVPTDNVKKGGGLFIDANQRGRVVCPISFWMQILALGPITS